MTWADKLSTISRSCFTQSSRRKTEISPSTYRPDDFIIKEYRSDRLKKNPGNQSATVSIWNIILKPSRVA